MARKRVSFPNARGELLAGILESPNPGEQRACALFAHCFTCGKNLLAAANISRALTDHGIAVLRFDFTGLGESEGDFAETSFSTNVSDLQAAADFLAATIGPPQLLIGHSLGGTAMLMAAPEIHAARAVVTIGSPARADHVRRQIEGREEVQNSGEAVVSIGGRPFRIRREFLEDLENQPVAERLHDLGRALLVCHSPVDTIVSIDNASEIFQNARHPKSFLSLDNADHLLSDKHDAAYLGGMIAAWLERYLPAAEPATAEGEEGVVTAVTGAEGFRTSITAGNHRLLGDEPASVGGENSGPTPYGLLAAALASCTSMTLQMYARRKRLDLASASVSVRHEKLHASDCADCETAEGRIDHFARRVRLTGDLSPEARRRLLEIADRCPVHRTLTGEIRISTELEP